MGMLILYRHKVNEVVICMLKFDVGNQCPIIVESGASIMYTGGIFTVFIKMSDLFDEDIKAFRNNELKIALCKYDPKTLFFVYGIKGFVYMSDIAFNINMTLDKIAGLGQNFTEGTGYGFTFILIEEETNIVKAMRTVGVTKKFSDVINTCCIDQYNAGTEGYEETVQKVYTEYSPERLVQQFIVGGCRFRGND